MVVKWCVCKGKRKGTGWLVFNGHPSQTLQNLRRSVPLPGFTSTKSTVPLTALVAWLKRLGLTL